MILRSMFPGIAAQLERITRSSSDIISSSSLARAAASQAYLPISSFILNSFGLCAPITKPKGGDPVSLDRVATDTRQLPLADARGASASCSSTPPRIGCDALVNDTTFLPSPRPVPQGTPDPSLRARVARGWGRFFQAWLRLERGWVGDVIGGLCMCGLIYMTFLFAWVLSA